MSVRFEYHRCKNSLKVSLRSIISYPNKGQGYLHDSQAMVENSFISRTPVNYSVLRLCILLGESVNLLACLDSPYECKDGGE